MTEINVLTVNGTSYALRDADAEQRLDSLANEVVINNTDRIEAEEALREALTAVQQDLAAEKQSRRDEDENILNLAKEHTDAEVDALKAADDAASARLDSLANEVVINNNDRIQAEEAMLSEAKAYTDTQVSEERSERRSGENALLEADSALGARLDALEKGYRHIATITNDSGEDVVQIDVTQDKDGNAFECSEIFVYATIPPAKGGQFYIGTELPKWIFFSGSIKSTMVTRTLTFQMKHTGGGWWQCKALFGDNISNPWIGISASDRVLENFRSYVCIGEKVNRLCMYGGNGPFPNGTVFEIYGK